MREAVLAAGGTGGHLFPAQALAEALLARGWRVTLSTDERGAAFAGGFPEAVGREVVASATPARGGALGQAAAPFRIAAGIGAAVLRMRRERPAAVVGFGGYPSIPALSAALLLRVPAVIHEANGVLGRVNRAFAARVERVACGTWPTAVPRGARAEHVGNPVRAAVAERAGAPYRPPGPGVVRLLVIGGSQGARVLSDVVPAAVLALPEALRGRVKVAQQARPEDVERVRLALPGAEVEPFFGDVGRRMAEAQLVVARAGASTLADLACVGRPAVLIPYAAAAEDHQTANARGPVEAGAAVAIAERDLTPEALAEALAAILLDPPRAASMARAAARQGRPDAAERLASLVDTLATPLGDARP